MSEHDILQLIFEPGFSTAEAVTQVSGRGVGMDVVRAVMERIKGTVAVDTRPGQGTRFMLRVPLTLAIIKALLFRVSDRLYAVPLGSVLEITRATETDIHRIENHETMRLRKDVLTLVRLSDLPLQPSNGHSPPAPRSSKAKMFVVVISVADRKFGLIVDKLFGEEELVIKALDDHLAATELVSGASILGDGTVVLVLNLSAVVDRLGGPRSVCAAPLGVLAGQSRLTMGAQA